MQIIEDQTFQSFPFFQEFNEPKEFDNCTFERCDFSHQNLSNFRFIDCTFEDCNLGLATLENTQFQSVLFSKCKLIGLKFEQCNSFGMAVQFVSCVLDFSSFYQCVLKNTSILQCSLREVDFTESVWVGSRFTGSDLSLSVFDRTQLEKVDFREAINYQIDPENNSLKGAQFSLAQVSGLLTKYSIKIE